MRLYRELITSYKNVVGFIQVELTWSDRNDSKGEEWCPLVVLQHFNSNTAQVQELKVLRGCFLEFEETVL